MTGKMSSTYPHWMDLWYLKGQRETIHDIEFVLNYLQHQNEHNSNNNGTLQKTTAVVIA